MEQHKSGCPMISQGWAASVPPHCICFDNHASGGSGSSTPAKKEKECCEKCKGKGYWSHGLGAHSDTRDSEPCYCNQDSCGDLKCPCHKTAPTGADNSSGADVINVPTAFGEVPTEDFELSDTPTFAVGGSALVVEPTSDWEKELQSELSDLRGEIHSTLLAWGGKRTGTIGDKLSIVLIPFIRSLLEKQDVQSSISGYEQGRQAAYEEVEKAIVKLPYWHFNEATDHDFIDTCSLFRMLQQFKAIITKRMENGN